MPKKDRVLTEINYSYLRPVNDTWVRKTYKKLGFSSRSEFMDTLVNFFRKNKLDNKIQKTIVQPMKRAVRKSNVTKISARKSKQNDIQNAA